LEKGAPADRSAVISKVIGQVLHMSKHKFASNVVEKCIIFANDEERSMMVEEIIAPKPDGSSTIGAMLKDQVRDSLESSRELV
jgi:pumilio RNA-binding family